jgi:hypothetical protein
MSIDTALPAVGTGVSTGVAAGDAVVVPSSDDVPADAVAVKGVDVAGSGWVTAGLGVGAEQPATRTAASTVAVLAADPRGVSGTP